MKKKYSPTLYRMNRKTILLIAIIVSIILAILGFILISLVIVVGVYFFLPEKKETVPETSSYDRRNESMVNADLDNLNERLDEASYKYKNGDFGIVSATSEIDNLKPKAKEVGKKLFWKIDDEGVKLIGEGMLRRTYEKSTNKMLDNYAYYLRMLHKITGETGSKLLENKRKYNSANKNKVSRSNELVSGFSEFLRDATEDSKISMWPQVMEVINSGSKDGEILKSQIDGYDMLYRKK